MCRTPFSAGNAVGAGVRPSQVAYTPLTALSDKNPTLATPKDMYLSLYPDVKKDFRALQEARLQADPTAKPLTPQQNLVALNEYARDRLSKETDAVKEHVEVQRNKIKADKMALFDPLALPEKAEDVLARSQRFSLYVMLPVLWDAANMTSSNMPTVPPAVESLGRYLSGNVGMFTLTLCGGVNPVTGKVATAW